MADPFSVAGSAVGVISLGLTVCQGLLAYYGPFKAYDEQIHDVSNRIKSFNSTLEALKDVLANAGVSSSALTPRSATVALGCIFNCQEGLKRLKNMLDKCRKSPSTKSFLRSKIQIDRMLYPFRRDTLVTLLDTMSWLQADLNTSLQNLTMSAYRNKGPNILADKPMKSYDCPRSKANRPSHHVLGFERQ